MITINVTEEGVDMKLSGGKSNLINEITTAIKAVSLAINTETDLQVAASLNSCLRHNVLVMLFNTNLPEVQKLLEMLSLEG